MAANILRSELAVQMSVFMIRAFVRLRKHIAANSAILKGLAEIDKILLQHEGQTVVIVATIQGFRGCAGRS